MQALSEKSKRLYKVSEVARILDTSESHVYEMARQGILPTVRLARQVRVDRQALEDWIRKGGQALPGGWRREAK